MRCDVVPCRTMCDLPPWAATGGTQIISSLASALCLHNVCPAASIFSCPGLNEYVTENLAFEFHYFFTRKFWMLYHCQALVVAPGGFGTLDELFEVRF